jgi:hypothetical protein
MMTSAIARGSNLGIICFADGRDQANDGEVTSSPTTSRQLVFVWVAVILEVERLTHDGMQPANLLLVFRDVFICSDLGILKLCTGIVCLLALFEQRLLELFIFELCSEQVILIFLLEFVRVATGLPVLVFISIIPAVPELLALDAAAVCVRPVIYIRDVALMASTPRQLVADSPTAWARCPAGRPAC